MGICCSDNPREEMGLSMNMDKQVPEESSAPDLEREYARMIRSVGMADPAVKVVARKPLGPP